MLRTASSERMRRKVRKHVQVAGGARSFRLEDSAEKLHEETRIYFRLIKNIPFWPSSESTSIAFDSILGSTFGSTMVFGSFFLHISWRFACCGGAAFMDFGISKNFPGFENQ